MNYTRNFKGQSYSFRDLKTLLAKASPLRSADELAGIAATSETERAVAQWLLADLPLKQFLSEPLIPPEDDEVSRLIATSHDLTAFAPISSFTVGELREWLLTDATTDAEIAAARWGLTPEMAAAVAKIMRNQDLIAVAKRCHVTTRFRNTIGLPGRLATRLQPNHPTDDPRGIAASVLDGLLYGNGDAVIGINPATDN
ncbi:MAG: ethanolamine ammonia-lyase subunit EutB, partial [Desulfuromonadaceae bacterium]